MSQARAYYNEIDDYAAQWLRNLITQGLIADGDVDTRSIADVTPNDVKGYTQCHFFAGIGGWSIALRLAAWPDHREVWTGSCPCQPFSLAGAQGGFDDKRHLWPAWHWLIEQCRPAVVLGEQVASAVGKGWLDLVCADLEGEGYATGASVLPACGVGAPHIRNRLWFVAHANGGNAGAEGIQRGGEQRQQPQNGAAREMADTASARRPDERQHQCGSSQLSARSPEYGRAGELANPLCTTGERRTGSLPGAEALLDSTRIINGHIADGFADGGEAGDLADTASGRFGELGNAAQPRRRRHADGGFELGGMADSECDGGRPNQPERRPQGRVADGWACAEFIECTDGKARPIEPGSFPLAHGIQRRTSKLRAYGNAIVPQAGAAFIEAVMDIL